MRSLLQPSQTQPRQHKRRDVFFVLYVFCALFAPPLIPGINFILLVAIYSVIALLTKYRKDLLSLLSKTGLKQLSIGLILYFAYTGLIIFGSVATGNNVQTDHYIRMFYSFFLLFPVTTVCALYIVARSKASNYSLVDLMKIFVGAGLIQAGLAIATLLSPDIKDFLIAQMFANTADPLLDTPWITNIRYFGFANSMLDLFGFGMGIIAVLSLFLATEKKFAYILLFPILLISPLLNARTGLLVAIIGFFFFLLYLVIKRRSVTLLVTLGCIVAVTVIGLRIVANYAPDTIAWVARDVSSFVTSDSQGGTASTLFSEQFWKLPDTLGLTVGTGHTLYQAKGFSHSDVGYINDLWRTGMIGIFLLYIPFLLMFRQSVNWPKSKLASILAIFFVCIIALFQFKGNIWVYSPGIVIILSITFFNILQNSTKSVTREVKI